MKLRSVILGASAMAVLSVGSAKADGELFLYNWSNYFPPALMEKFEILKSAPSKDPVNGLE